MKLSGSAIAGLLPLAALCISSVAAHPLDRRDGWGVSTVTWTETRTYTSTISSYYPPAYTAPAGQNCVPPPGSGQIACGPICCATWQWCQDPIKGQCLANVGQNSWTEVITTGVTTGVIVTTQFSAPYRPTSGSASTPTGTFDSATVVPTGGPQETVPADSTTSGSQLSGGAIAGIVIGTIAGLALLILCCFCCIVRGLWGAFAALFGGKKKDKERVEIIEERYSRHGSQHGGRPAHKGWFGGFGGGGRPADVASRKEKKSGGGLGWLAASAGAAALLLGLKKHDANKRRASSHKSRSDWSSSYYTDSYTGSSPSSRSSDRRTRNTNRSRRSGQSRATRQSRRSSRI
ncbi:hypothetical protein Micbo1qcDRAFT_162760 [Microdochium bolleyi]|uniref:Mid2 domain-containing protein n=1 Tax=Microdochium bolleyi TaxID=196109 RepID=A0A136J635_9PEZI|nr:hypothetical protein Micbo1qcDRAFT_162760 [Microdochium bolleyi]